MNSLKRVNNFRNLVQKRYFLDDCGLFRNNYGFCRHGNVGYCHGCMFPLYVIAGGVLGFMGMGIHGSFTACKNAYNTIIRKTD